MHDIIKRFWEMLSVLSTLPKSFLNIINKATTGSNHKYKP